MELCLYMQKCALFIAESACKNELLKNLLKMYAVVCYYYKHLKKERLLKHRLKNIELFFYLTSLKYSKKFKKYEYH